MDHDSLYTMPFSSEITRQMLASKQRDAQNKNLVVLTETITKQSKQISQLVEISKRQNESSEKVNKISLRVSLIAVILAGFSAVLAGISAYFSLLDYKGDELWQEKQIEVLSEVKDSFNFNQPEQIKSIIEVEDPSIGNKESETAEKGSLDTEELSIPPNDSQQE